MTQIIDSFRGEFYFLSNFSQSPMTVPVANFNYPFTFVTGEHLFHAAKISVSSATIDAQQQYLDALAKDANPNKAKYLGRSISIDPTRWDAMSYKVMERVQKIKFEQHPELAQKLINTGDSMLIEGNTWGDRLWGMSKGEGKNQLGIILMDLRHSLKNQS